MAAFEAYRAHLSWCAYSSLNPWRSSNTANDTLRVIDSDIGRRPIVCALRELDAALPAITEATVCVQVSKGSTYYLLFYPDASPTAPLVVLCLSHLYSLEVYARNAYREVEHQKSRHLLIESRLKFEDTTPPPPCLRQACASVDDVVAYLATKPQPPRYVPAPVNSCVIV